MKVAGTRELSIPAPASRVRLPSTRQVSHTIAYADDDGALRYAWHDGNGWSATTVDTKAMYVSLAIDREDTPHIAYCDGSGTLEYAWSDAGEWQTMTVDRAAWPGLGYYCSITTDTAGHPSISYYDMKHDALKYAYGTFGEPAPTFSANFTALPVSGQAPLTVSFTDVSRGDPTFRTYDFGDGFTSTATNQSIPTAHPARIPLRLPSCGQDTEPFKRIPR